MRETGGQGEGGILSNVSLNGSLIIAAGGGGGGGGDDGIVIGDPSVGDSCTEFDTIGSNGSPTEAAWADSHSSSGGKAGKNYYDSTKITSKDGATSNTDDYSNNGGGAVYISCKSTDPITNPTLIDYNVEASFAENFELITENPVSISGATSGTINGSLVPNIVPTENVTSKVQHVDFTVTYKLKAKDSCLGGNSILLLKNVKISQVVEGTSTADDVIYAEAKDTTDYANVAISQTYVNSKFSVTANTIDYIVGESGISKSQLYSTNSTFTPSSTDYVESYLEESPSIKEVSTPTTNETYYIYYGLKPKTNPVNGIVGPIAVKTYVNSNYTATINAYYEVEYNLIEVTPSATKHSKLNTYVAPVGSDYSLTLTPVSGKVVKLGAIKIGDTEYEDYTSNLNKDTGVLTLTIPKAAITDTIGISADARNKETLYSIYYAYATDLDGNEKVKTEVGIKAGTDITSTVASIIDIGTPTSIPGYKYVIEYPTGEVLDYKNTSTKFTTMPAENCWIFAYYTPIEYTLTINYENTSEPSVSTKYFYGTEFGYASPNVSSKAPKTIKVDGTEVTTYGTPALVCGTMPNKNLTIDVGYESIGPNDVIVTINYADNPTKTNQQTITKDGDGNITVEFDSPTGYDITTSATGLTSNKPYTTSEAYITITYTPHQSSITFNSGSGASAVADRAAFYGQSYGYTLVDGKTGFNNISFEPFPVPIKNGWVFDGWYIDNTQILESTLFKGTSDVTLTANWIPYELSKAYVTIKPIDDQTYTGNALKPTVKLVWNTENITWKAADTEISSTHYSVEYKKNVNVLDTPVITIKFNGFKYSGTFKTTFNIKQASNAITNLTLDDWTFGSPNSPSITATFGVDTVTYLYSNDGIDYSITTQPTNVGTYYVKATIPETSNYASATKTKSFKITAKTSSNITVELTPKDGFTYDGDEHTFKNGNIVVKDGDTPLTEGTDYEIEYDNKTNPPKGKFTIKFKGNYESTPEKEVEYPINPADLTSDGKLHITVTPKTFEYSGEQCKPTVTIEHDTFDTLVEGIDFYVTYLNNIEPGTASATITFIGKYTGSKTESFTINTADMSSDGNLSISLSQTEYTYNGKPCKPTVTVSHTTFGTLTLNTDYTVKYEENTNAGQATVTITFTEIHFKGSKAINFTINPLDLTNSSKVKITLSQSSYVYTGLECKPAIESVSHDDGLTINDNEYSIIGYSNNINAGINALVNISYSVNYTGTATKDFTISYKPITPVITITPDPMTYTGKDLKPTVTVKDENGNPLKEGTDFIVTYPTNPEPPTGTIKIEFINNYEGNNPVNEDFTINKSDLSSDKDLTITLSPVSYVYDGTAKTPTVTVSHTTFGTLTLNTDYTVSYSDNKEVGTATATITFTGSRFEGSTTRTFEILPANLFDDPLKLHITVTPTTFEYTGKQCKPTVTIEHDTFDTLVEGTDFYVTYLNNIEPGTASATITFIGKYTGSKTENFTIDKADMSSDGKLSISLSQTEYTYSGKENKPTATVTHTTFGTLTLTTDYTVSYSENTDAGQATVTINFTGTHFEGSKVENFTINPLDLTNSSKVHVTLSKSSYVYTGSECEPTINAITHDDGLTIKSTEYSITGYSNNINVGTNALVNISYSGNYTGTTTAAFAITQASNAITNLTLDDWTFGTPNSPSVTATFGASTVTYQYSDNESSGYSYIKPTDVGTYYVKATISETSNYASATKTESFKITSKAITPTIIITPEEETFNGDEIEPTVIVKDENGKPLEEGKDYNIIYDDNTTTPKGKIKIEFINNYDDTPDQNKEFTIKSKAPTDSETTITLKQYTYTYSGNANEPAVTIFITGIGDLVEGTDFDVTYSNNINAGTATANIEYKGNYSGKAYENFTINKKQPTILKPITWDYDGTVTYVYDGTVKSVSLENVPEGYTPIYFNEAHTKAGTYKTKVDFSYDEENFEPITVNPLTWTIKKADYDMSNAKWDYESAFTYDGSQKKVQVIGLPQGVTVVKYSNEAKTVAGTYKAVAVLDYDVDNYNAPSIDDLTWTINQKDINPSKTDETGTATIETEDGIPVDVELVVELKASAEGKETESGNKLKLENELGFGEAFGDVYEIKIVRDGQEIQPEDIAPGTVLKLKMKVPENLVGKDFRIIHIHNNDDISYIIKGNAADIGTYIIDEEGYIVTMVNKFSEFTFVYNIKCISHWFLLAFLLLFIAFVAVYLTVLVKKIQKEKTKILVPVIVCAVFALATIITALLGTCYYCIIMTIINGVTLLIALLIFGFFFFKKRPLVGKVEVAQDGQNATPMQQPEELLDLIKKVAEKVLVDSGKEIKETVQEEVQEENAEEVKEETQEEVKEEVEEKVVEETAPLALKDSIALAKANTTSLQEGIDPSKAAVCKYLSKYEDVELNTRANYTVTGLPLADTHYQIKDSNRVCFIYVYEFEDNKALYLVRADKETAAKLQAKHPALTSSAFPKSPNKDWYTMVIDDSFKTNDDIHEALDMLLGKEIIKEENAEEIAPLSLKDSIALAKANTAVVKEELDPSKAAICKYLSKYEDVELNTRGNYTVTGLPLADTHYQIKDSNRVCFTYVYEFEDGKALYLIKADKETAKKLQDKHPAITSSAFPKCPTKDWYTVVIDDSFKTNDDIHEVFDLALGKEVELISNTDFIKEDEPLSLKDSIALAKTNSQEEKEELNINKKVVCDYLAANYKDTVEINTRVNYTVTGLPLADTHYDLRLEKKVCFTYVYELEDGKVFFLIRANKEVAENIKKLHPALTSSAFPKSPNKDWYTLILDDTFKSNNDVFDVIDMILGKVKESDGLSLKDSIKLAKEDVSAPKEELNISKKAIVDYLTKYEDVEINTRGNYTVTGLPLADTHYQIKDGNRVCFTYVYELENGKVFLLIRSSKDTAAKIKTKHTALASSAFPKAPNKDWHTLIIDDTFSSNIDVYDVLDMVLGKGEETEALSLKESLALAKEKVVAPKEELNPSKAAICKYLSLNYKDSVEINTRGNYTVTGLPLADTHYQIKDGNRVCFTYVYELENGNTLLLVKADKDAISKIKAKHSSVQSSAFPKCPTKDWYTVVIDDTFKSNDDVYDVFDIVLSSSKTVSEPAKEEVKEAVSLKESIELAKSEDNTQSKVDISKKVIKEYLDKNYQGIVEANSRVNYTKTGLPLADTYYDIKSAKKVCFAYCYELEDNKTFFLIRANEETINKIMKKHPGIKSSAFPKEPADSWYTMVIDDSFKSNEDVYEVLDILISAKKFEKSLIEQLIDSIE